MIDIEDMLKTCLPGGNLCDPQMVADDIRAYVERVQAPSNEMPTEPGLYWWRERQGGEWRIVVVDEHVFRFADFMDPDLRDTWESRYGIGQWLPCLPPASPKPIPTKKFNPISEGWSISYCDQYFKRVGDGEWIVPVGVGCQMLHEDHGSICWDKALEGALSVKGALYRMSASEREAQG